MEVNRSDFSLFYTSNFKTYMNNVSLESETMQTLFGGRERVRVAIAQAAPAYYDKDKTIDKARHLISEASSQRADFVVFPETWVSGYPYWILAALGEDNAHKYARVLAMLQDSSIQIPSEETEKLCDAARRHRVHVVIGCNELSDIPGSRTVYNTLLFIDDGGNILGKHRKLMPTHEERVVWGMGDGSDLRVYPTKIGRIGGLVCWENHMILARAAMIMKGEEFHVAAWPGSWRTNDRLYERDGEGKYCDLFPAIREHAFEAGAFVVSACPIITPDQVPSDFPYREQMLPTLAQACGGSAIVDPFGNFLVDPVFDKESLIFAECEADSIKVAKTFFDSLGHYARFDVFRLDLREDGWRPFSDGKRLLPQPNLKKLAEKYEIDADKLEQIFVELNEKVSEGKKELFVSP
jgi:amidase/nitrilase